MPKTRTDTTDQKLRKRRAAAAEMLRGAAAGAMLFGAALAYIDEHGSLEGFKKQDVAVADLRRQLKGAHLIVEGSKPGQLISQLRGAGN